TSLVVRKSWTVVSASVIANLRFSRHHAENKSSRQRMLKLFVEVFNARIQSEAQHVAPIDPSQPPGASNDHEAEGPDALQQVGVRPFAGATLRLRAGVELKVPEQVMGEHAQLLPGTVGAVVIRRYDIERELALQLGERLLLRAAPTHEGKERRQAERQVGRGGVVLEVAVVRGEQIELEILAGLVLDVLAVDHHA